MGLNSPFTSAGASGFGSHISRWLGPPFKKMTMHASALAEVAFGKSFALRSCGSARPRYDAAPAVIICRREIRGPGQCDCVGMQRALKVGNSAGEVDCVGSGRETQARASPPELPPAMH